MKFIGFSLGNETIEEIAERMKVPVGSLNPKLAKAVVIHGSELKSLDQDQLDDVLRFVFAQLSDRVIYAVPIGRQFGRLLTSSQTAGKLKREGSLTFRPEQSKNGAHLCKLHRLHGHRLAHFLKSRAIARMRK